MVPVISKAFAPLQKGAVLWPTRLRQAAAVCNALTYLDRGTIVGDAAEKRMFNAVEAQFVVSCSVLQCTAHLGCTLVFPQPAKWQTRLMYLCSSCKTACAALGVVCMYKLEAVTQMRPCRMVGQTVALWGRLLHCGQTVAWWGRLLYLVRPSPVQPKGAC